MDPGSGKGEVWDPCSRDCCILLPDSPPPHWCGQTMMLQPLGTFLKSPRQVGILLSPSCSEAHPIPSSFPLRSPPPSPPLAATAFSPILGLGSFKALPASRWATGQLGSAGTGTTVATEVGRGVFPHSAPSPQKQAWGSGSPLSYPLCCCHWSQQSLPQHSLAGADRNSLEASCFSSPPVGKAVASGRSGRGGMGRGVQGGDLPLIRKKLGDSHMFGEL